MHDAGQRSRSNNCLPSSLASAFEQGLLRVYALDRDVAEDFSANLLRRLGQKRLVECGAHPPMFNIARDSAAEPGCNSALKLASGRDH